jgi:hypothetical protein
VAVSGDGRRAVSGGYDGRCGYGDLEAGTVAHALPGRGSVTAVAVSADDRRAVSASDDRMVRV